MAKAKKTTAFFCQECGFESAKWVGQCPACKAWNSMVEEPLKMAPAAAKGISPLVAQEAVSLADIPDRKERRIPTGFSELDRVLGGGIVEGSLTLLGGDPGIGKSTLLLQAAAKIASEASPVLYISGEESLQQIALRATRIGRMPAELKFLCETDLDRIEAAADKLRPAVMVVDSIQTMSAPSVEASPGSVSQVREATGRLMRLAKESGIAILIVGHVTKDGTVAGPRVLEHMVDTVLYFEGDRYAAYRVLRGVKNRFGSTNEIGVFEMCGEGLIEVPNPSEYLLDGRPSDASGAVVTCSMEGTRPLLVEVQALVTKSSFGFPKRQAAGTDFNRVSVLMAVMEKRLGLPLSQYDAYVNLAGGIRQREPSLDLGIVMAILSSYRNEPVSSGVVAFGEVGLSGEVRAVTMAELRVQEAAKLGFTTCILPKANVRKMKQVKGITLIGVESIAEVRKS